MKKIQIITIILTLLSMNVFSQTWMQGIAPVKSKTAVKQNFFNVQKSFYDSYKKETKEKDTEENEKDDQYQQFKRWEWYWEQRVGKTGEFPSASHLWKEWDKYTLSHPEAKIRSSVPTLSRSSSTHTSLLPYTATWSFIGPTSSTSDYQGVGRVNCIAFHPTDANTFWVGTPDGGLWKTTDGGSTWGTLTDNLPVLGVSDIAICPTHPDSMYIATGDGDHHDSKSVGVLFSSDGGTTWSTTGLNWDVTSQFVLSKLLMNPDNHSVLMAAGSNGIWRSANAGSSWSNVQTGDFVDLVYNPTNSSIVYATTYDYFGGNAQIYRSADTGSTWTLITTIAGAIRIKLAVTVAAPSNVDALCANTSSGLLGMWRSSDNGLSFTQYFTGDCSTSSTNMLGWQPDASDCGGQGWYDLCYAINPIDANEIFLGGVNTWKSIDAGSSWSIANYWSSPSSVPTVHADKHWIAYHPLLSNTLFECNDGGLYKTTDGGVSWTNLTSGLGISQIYRIGTSATIANDVLTGLQDNGSKEYVSSTWNNRTGGDGTECLIDFSNSSIQYSSYVKGEIYKTTDDWFTTLTTIVTSGGTGVNEDGNWVTPFIMHPTMHNIILVGKSQVYFTMDGGSTWSNFGTISGATGNIVAMAFAPSNPSTVYVAYMYSLYKTNDGGGSWTSIRTSSDAFTYIAVDPSNENNLWVTTSGYSSCNKVFNSPDGGSTWNNISGSLPNVPANCIVYQNNSYPGLYVGTDLGVYFYCLSCGTTDWTTYNTGLPNVVVDELEISYNNNKLWAATFGRGLWKSDLASGSTIFVPAITGDSILCTSTTGTLSDALPGGTWSISNTAIATIDATTGIVTALSVGIDTVTYTISSSTATKVITVNTLPNSGSISGLTTMCLGSVITLSDVGASVTGTWSASNTNVSVDGTNGYVTGLVIGTTTISYTVTNMCGTTNATYDVSALDSTTYHIVGTTSICFGTSATLSIGASLQKWTSSDTFIATIDSNLGTITTITKGTVIITCTYGCGIVDTTSFYIDSLPYAGVISGQTTLCMGSVTTITDSGSVAPGTWSATNSSLNIDLILNVDTVIVSGLTPVFDTLYYSVTGTCGTNNLMFVVNVLDSTLYPITGNTIVCAGLFDTLYNASNYKVWSSSNTAVAVIDASTGIITPQSQGTVIITCTYGCGSIDTTTFTVDSLLYGGEIKGLSNICIGTITTLLDSGAIYVGTWSATNSNITIDPSGTVTSYVAGLDTIMYSLTNYCGTSVVTFNLNSMDTTAFTITGTTNVCTGLFDTLYNASLLHTWSSSDSLVARIDSLTGIITGMTVGVVTITCTNSCGIISTVPFSVNLTPDAGTITFTSILCAGRTDTLHETILGGVWSTLYGYAAPTTDSFIYGVSAGTDSVFYSVTTVCGTAKTGIQITVNPLPSSGTISGNTMVCVNAHDTLMSTAIGGTWSVSNTCASIDAGGHLLGVNAGTEIATYTFVNVCGTAHSEYVVTVNPLPYAGGITGATYVCIGSTITLTDTIIGGSWTAINSNATVADSFITGVYFGTDTIFYMYTNLCGTDTTSKIISIDSLPNAGIITGSNDSVCELSTLALSETATDGSWGITNSSIATIASGVVSALVTGLDTVLYTATNICGTLQSSYPIVVKPLPHAGVITGRTVVCEGDTAILSETVLDGTWSSKDTTIAQIIGDTLKGIKTGLDSVFYTVTNSCGTDIAHLLVNISPAPNAGTITGQTGVCVGATITLYDTVSGGTWDIQNANALLGAAGVITGSIAGLDTVYYNFTNSCGSRTASLVLTISTSPLPPGIFRIDDTLYTTSMATSFQWFKNGNPISTATDVVYTLTDTGYYTLQISNTFGCLAMSDSFHVTSLAGIANIFNTDGGIRIYPNPAKTIVYLETEKAVDVQLTTTDSKVILEAKDTKNIDLQNLPAGVYFINIFDNRTGLKLKTDKIIKL